MQQSDSIPSALYQSFLGGDTAVIDPQKIFAQKLVFKAVVTDDDGPRSTQALGREVRAERMVGDVAAPVIVDGREIQPDNDLSGGAEPAATRIAASGPSPSKSAKPSKTKAKSAPAKAPEHPFANVIAQQAEEREIEGSVTFITPIGGFDCPYYSAIQTDHWLTLIGERFPDLSPNTEIPIRWNGQEYNCYCVGIRVYLPMLDATIIHLLMLDGK